MLIGRVLAREAQDAGEPCKPVCPVCKGLEVVRTPLDENEAKLNSPYRGYAYHAMIACPTCSEPARRAWLERNCGLEPAQREPLLVNWQPGDWVDIDKAEIDRRVQQRRVAYGQIRSAVKHKCGLFTYWGDFGSGKSLALVTTCNELRTQMVETYYTTMAAVLDHLKTLYASRQDTSEYWQRLLDVPVLALDEVTRFHSTEWAQQMVFLLVNTRYERRKSHLTLFATNDDPNQAYPPGDPLGYMLSRMKEGKRIELRGDFRPIAADEWWHE